MTRFERELNGNLGEFWKRSAEQELEQLRSDLASGKITINDHGVARNCIGRVLMSDLLEKLAHITDAVSIEATTAAREAEVAAELAEYCQQAHEPSREELNEMRATFGPDEKVMNIFTGEIIDLGKKTTN